MHVASSFHKSDVSVRTLTVESTNPTNLSLLLVGKKAIVKSVVYMSEAPVVML